MNTCTNNTSINTTVVVTAPVPVLDELAEQVVRLRRGEVLEVLLLAEQPHLELHRPGEVVFLTYLDLGCCVWLAAATSCVDSTVVIVLTVVYTRRRTEETSATECSLVE